MADVDNPTLQERSQRLIQFLDRPLLILAVLSIVMYLAELHSLLPPFVEWNWYHIVMLGIDLIFVIDLTLKVATLRTSYLRTPWFLIDLISCLPILTALPIFSTSMQSLRFVRGFRMFRVLRSLRILRLLQSLPAFQQFQEQAAFTGGAKRFERALFFGVILFSAIFMMTLVGVKKYLYTEHKADLLIRLQRDLTIKEIRALGGSLNPKEYRDSLVLIGHMGGKEVKLYFDNDEVTHIANLVEFYLVLGALLGMLLLFYLFVHLLKDVSYQQIRGILNIVLPRQVADQFLRNPRSYMEKHRMPGTIMFIDIKGFTKACEELGNDLDTLSKHLEGVMDSLALALSEKSLIIDKFMGDSIMSFAGGPLCPGTPKENAARVVRAALIALDEMKRYKDPYFGDLKIGGASTPDCLIGAFGTSTRLSYTVLGDGVNLAARLEAACSDTLTSNLFCDETRRLCAELDDVLWRCWGTIRVKGKAEPQRVYEAFDTDRLHDTTFIDTYHKAWDTFANREFAQAKALFQQAHTQREGGDPPSLGYVEWCDDLLQRPPSDSWEPVLRTRK